VARSHRRVSFLKFLLQYPVFLLAFGPPIFRPNEGIDATKGNVDFWAFFQVGWIVLIAVRALLRLLSAREILVPKPIRSILRLFFILGLLFMSSVAYSPSRSVSAAYTALYFLAVICVVEFVIDAYRNPPDWMQCLMHFRLICFLLFILVLSTLLFKPIVVMVMIPGIGIRLGGGTVAPVTVICPMIAIISGYAFLFSLESKARSTFFFLVGLAGTLIAQSRGSELALLASLALVGFIWAGTGKRSSYLFLATSIATVLLSGAVLAVVGGGRIWNLFNRGQDIGGIESASGRTDIWKFIIHYCMAHPLGMGYVAGFRVIFREYFALGLQFDVKHIGNAHNTFLNVLAGAGWPALAIYLFLLVKSIAIGWRYARKRALFSTASEDNARHALRCTLVLLVFCLAGGMDSADFSVPLRASFYLQNIIIAMILGISARMIAASRTQYVTSSE
jgi:hypothetical protein